MPISSDGKFRPNHQLARQADKSAAARTAKPPQASKPGMAGKPAMEDPNEGGGSELHAHGDGSYHSVIDGAKTEHPSIGHALVHMAAHHEPEGTHVHAHHDGMSVKMHHAADGGDPQASEHESPEEAGQHMASVMNGEGGEMPSDNDGDEGMGMAGMHAMMRG